MRPELIGLLGALALSLLLGSIACSTGETTDATPDGALQLFLDSMTRRDRDKAYKLITPAAQKALQQRAKRATKEGGRTFEPAEMIAVERFVLRWEVTKLEPSIQGNRATVTVHGKEASQREKVQLERVDGHWRVALPID